MYLFVTPNEITTPHVITTRSFDIIERWSDEALNRGERFSVYKIEEREMFLFGAGKNGLTLDKYGA